jgi:hypothetical protein
MLRTENIPTQKVLGRNLVLYVFSLKRITKLNRFLLENLIVSQLIKKFHELNWLFLNNIDI